MSELQFTTVDRVLAKFHRDLKGTDLNESDAIDWIGEALEFLKVKGNQEETIAFMEVKDFEVDLPQGFQMVLQIAKDNNWTPEIKKTSCPAKLIKEISTTSGCTPFVCSSDHPANKAGYSVPLDCNGRLLGDYEVAYYRPSFDLVGEYYGWVNSSYYKANYTPVRLANHSFFNSLVCKEKNSQALYQNCEDEYTIVGTTEKKLRFSFQTGYVAVSYIKTAIDTETGYPLIPDHISHITAITYYIKWKIAEWYRWNGRDGFAGISKESEEKWIKYCRQAKNYIKMPKSLDQYQNLLEQSHYLIPRHKRYYGFFGKLGKEENRKFNNPDYNKRFYTE